MATLQRRWYNCLTRTLLLPRETFQITHCSPEILSDHHLWALENALPPKSLSVNLRLLSGLRFFDEYAAIVGQLEIPKSFFEHAIGAGPYKQWSNYLKQLNPAPAESQIAVLFRKWAIAHAPSVMTAGLAALAQIALLEAARRALLPYLGADAKPVDFSGSYDELLQSVGQGSSRTIGFDSSSIDDDVDDTWTGGVDVNVDCLWPGAVTSDVSRTFAGSRVSLTAAANACLVWTATPGPWYDSSLLNIAFSNRSTPPWARTRIPPGPMYLVRTAGCSS